MAFCYCHLISCVTQDFWWYFTLRAQYTRNSAVGELKYFRGQWDMKQVAELPSVGHSLQFFGTWNTVKTIIIRISEHFSEDTTSVGLQFMEGNIGSLELISSWRQENESSNWLELPMSKVQDSRAVSVLRLKLCIAWELRSHGQPFQVSFSGSCSVRTDLKLKVWAFLGRNTVVTLCYTFILLWVLLWVGLCLAGTDSSLGWFHLFSFLLTSSWNKTWEGKQNSYQYISEFLA